MLKDLAPEMAEEAQSLLLKLARRSMPLEHFLALEEVSHDSRCKLEDGYIYFSLPFAEGGRCFRGKIPEKATVKPGFLFTVLSSHLAEFFAAFSGKPVKTLPIRMPDLKTPLGVKFHDELAAIAEKLQLHRAKLLRELPAEEKAAEEHELERAVKSVNRETVRFFGLTKREVKLLKAVMEY